MTLTMMMMMMKTMFGVLVRRCQGVRPVGRHCPMTTEREQSCLVVSFFSLLLSAAIIIFITIIIMIGIVVTFTAHSSFLVSLCWLSRRFVDIRMVSSQENNKMNAAGKCDSQSCLFSPPLFTPQSYFTCLW